jgi:hypothetical protein
MTAYAAVVVALAAAILFFASDVGFWVACSLGFALVAFTAWSLKRVPRLTLDGLSPEAEALLERYNHAWVVPGVTRITALAISLWQILCIATGLYFLVESSWWSLAGVFVLFNAVSYLAGGVNPQMHIRMKGLGAANDEIVDALMRQWAERKSKALDLLDGLQAKDKT